MANFPANPITQLFEQFSPNIANAFMSFNLFLGSVTYSVASGTGTAVNTTAKYFKADRSLLLTSTDDSTDFIVNKGTDTRFTATQAKQHFFQFELNNPFGGCIAGELFALGVSINSASPDYYTVQCEDMDGFDTWKGFYFDFPLEIGDTVDFSWKLSANTSGTDHKVYFDGFQIESSNRSNAIPGRYNPPVGTLQPDIMTVVTTLNFPNTEANSENSIEVQFPRAQPGQVVVLGYTVEALGLNCIYYSYVNLPGSVIVVFQNNSSVAVNPANATFTIKIIP